MLKNKSSRQLLLDSNVISSNKHDLSNNIRILLMKSDPDLMNAYYHESDDFFLNPLLFAIFNTQGISEGRSYIKKILFHDYKYTAVEGERLLILEEALPFMSGFFFEMYRGKLTNSKPEFQVELSKVDEFKRALSTLSTYLPDYYREFINSNKLILLHNNPRIINFVTKSFQGFLSFWVTPEVSEVYFIEELVHQGAHNYLNLYFHKKEVFFKVDPEEIQMKDITGNEMDYRSLMSSIHGLYTVVKRIEQLRGLLELNVYQGKLKHELVGRYIDQLMRFRGLNVEHDNIPSLMTQKGNNFYRDLLEYGNAQSTNDEPMLQYFNMSFRDIDFYYSQYSQVNSYEQFKQNIEDKLNF